jgi:PhnB protein
MPKRSLAEQLDQAVQAMLDHPGTEASHADVEISPLLKVAAELRNLPREEFKTRLKRELQEDKGLSMSAAAEVVRPTVSAYLTFQDAAGAIEFYKRAFGATENMRLTTPDGKVMHAEIQIGNAPILLADEFPQYGAISPRTLGGSPVRMHLSVDDVDAFAKRAIEAGAKLLRPIENHFYGHRAGQLEDPFGYAWMISTPTEILTMEEVQRRFEGLFQHQGATKPKFAMREGFRTVTAYLVAQDVPGLIEF